MSAAFNGFFHQGGMSKCHLDYCRRSYAVLHVHVHILFIHGNVWRISSLPLDAMELTGRMKDEMAPISPNGRGLFRIWAGRLCVISLFPFLIIMAYMGDVYGLTHIAIAMLLIWLFTRSLGRVRSYSGMGYVSLIQASLRKSDNPSVEFRRIMLRMIRRRKPPKEEVTRILRTFSEEQSEVGLEARQILSSAEYGFTTDIQAES